MDATLLSSSPALVAPTNAHLTLDPSGNIAGWNEPAGFLFGLTPDAAMGQPEWRLRATSDGETVDRASQLSEDLSVATTTGRLEREEWRERWDGSRFWAVTTIIPLRVDGQLVGFVETINDLTQWQRRELELRQTLDSLSRSNADLEQFAYAASHDLQEPLRAIAGCVQLLQRRYGDQLDEGAHELIGHAVAGVERLQTLINDLLAYSRVTQREMQVEEVATEVIVDRALANLQTMIDETGTSILRGPLPTVRGDPRQLVLVFQNLISNGIKFRGERRAEVSISATRQGSVWIFEIRDNGIGIDPRHAERVFEVFRRLHRRNSYTGSGIGLSICKKIVERHGGKIWVEPATGGGSRFSFSIPD